MRPSAGPLMLAFAMSVLMNGVSLEIVAVAAARESFEVTSHTMGIMDLLH
jgi:hypothetical protein